jgi:hypothetical protein
MAISKQVGKAAGELAALFELRDNTYPQYTLQYEIQAILMNNGIKTEEQMC